MPVVDYSREQLIEFGASTPAEGLRQLPSFVGTTPNENDSNGGNGSAEVNLRGYGAENTLTLINGPRASAQTTSSAKSQPREQRF